MIYYLQIKPKNKWLTVGSGDYKFIRAASTRWVDKYRTNIVSKSNKSMHRYSVGMKKRWAKNYNKDVVSLKQIY